MKRHIVLQTDFGLHDGAVSAMNGVAFSVDPTLRISNLTHEIPQYNIWEASYRLYQTVAYWPEETVFISVVDPGVGTERLSIVAKTADGHYIVTPNNGTLTHLAKSTGIVAARVIDENVNRLPRSGESYTFHGRDVYAFTGARLAAGVIRFEEVGPELSLNDVVQLEIPQVTYLDGVIHGNIDILDSRFGNLWTNINREFFKQAGIDYGDAVEVTIEHNRTKVYKNLITFDRSFADRRLGEPLLFVNSIDNLGVAINQGSFADAYHIRSGVNWTITIEK
ncbi:SAM hydrolase/SAM-dependent halogenase family protein [Oceanobacillus alkalisoli]|uniref:SAM hydrolase/SAM-dependent halogenase family protein n=1 Tax=Oceanobacillus alkalisoli TaxID=2925113 RepID=UPI001EF02DAE|nr:S-adenosyl-l-methionine hydroxide adenosyltransferase family protein [Oceanobacillus alkalisoli]MCF3941980.1 S-adenosyl-l-methionine hydroxide adenosyltransferase family protein [Oceanobacillus alkalisoli]MCG5102067.1 S-adenosyl-l-methionine hydroxide adenosyltransferase family protein [Oceanobacillus alkalisoli]